jgi:hypothetical protein
VPLLASVKDDVAPFAAGEKVPDIMFPKPAGKAILEELQREAQPEETAAPQKKQSSYLLEVEGLEPRNMPMSRPRAKSLVTSRTRVALHNSSLDDTLRPVLLMSPRAKRAAALTERASLWKLRTSYEHHLDRLDAVLHEEGKRFTLDVSALRIAQERYSELVSFLNSIETEEINVLQRQPLRHWPHARREALKRRCAAYGLTGNLCNSRHESLRMRQPELASQRLCKESDEAVNDPRRGESSSQPAAMGPFAILASAAASHEVVRGAANEMEESSGGEAKSTLVDSLSDTLNSTWRSMEGNMTLLMSRKHSYL